MSKRLSLLIPTRGMKPEELVQNTWYIVFFKGTTKVVGEFVFTSYDKEKDSILTFHAIPLAFRKLCVAGQLSDASSYDYCTIQGLKYPKDHIHAKSGFYLRSLDALL